MPCESQMQMERVGKRKIYLQPEICFILDAQDSMSCSPSRTPSLMLTSLHPPAPEFTFPTHSPIPAAQAHTFTHRQPCYHSIPVSPGLTLTNLPKAFFFMFCHSKNIASFFPMETTRAFFRVRHLSRVEPHLFNSAKHSFIQFLSFAKVPSSTSTGGC